MKRKLKVFSHTGDYFALALAPTEGDHASWVTSTIKDHDEVFTEARLFMLAPQVLAAAREMLRGWESMAIPDINATIALRQLIATLELPLPPVNAIEIDTTL